MGPSPPRRSPQVRYLSPIKLFVISIYLIGLWLAGTFLAARFLAWIGYPDISP